MIIGELEKVVSVREATVGERNVPAIQRHRKPVSQRGGERFSSRTKRGAHAQDALLIYDLNNKRLSRKTEHSTDSDERKKSTVSFSWFYPIPREEICGEAQGHYFCVIPFES